MVTCTNRPPPDEPRGLRVMALTAALLAVACGSPKNTAGERDASVPPPAEEYCNGQDDDGDGLIDDVPCDLYYSCADPATCRCATSHVLCDGRCFARSLMLRTATCGGTCVFLDGDANCGACGNRCATGMRCNGGRCVCAELTCNGVCTAYDDNNCGACGRRCPSGAICQPLVQFTCQCPRPSLPCGPGGACVGFDDNNCGSCGGRCPDGTYCEGHSCAYR